MVGDRDAGKLKREMAEGNGFTEIISGEKVLEMLK